MTPPVAARASQSSTTSLRDRLKDPSLLRDRCYIDGAWMGTPSRPVTDPVNGVELAKIPVMSTAETTQAVEAAERAFPAWAKLTAKQRSRYFTQMVRPDHRQPRRSGADPDVGAGQAPDRGAWRDRYRRRLCRILRRRGASRLWRDHSDAARRRAAARDQAADRRLRRDHTVEFSVLDDHPKSVAGAGGWLHGGAQARQ